jgi:hypothetical protein
MQRYDGNEPGSSALRTGSSPRSIGGGGATASAPPPNRIKRAYSGIGNRYSVSRNPTKGWLGSDVPESRARPTSMRLAPAGLHQGECWLSPVLLTVRRAPAIVERVCRRPRTRRRFVRRRLNVGASQEAGVAHAAGSEVTLLRPRSRSPAAPAFLHNLPGFASVGKSAF